MEVKFLNFITTYLYCIKHNNIKYLIQLYKRIQDHTKHFSYIMGYTWKCLDMYFILCFMVLSIILNFNALCDVYILQKQSYIVLLKNNRLFCVKLGITFGNYILTVSDEGENHVRLYFAYFLNYPCTYV